MGESDRDGFLFSESISSKLVQVVAAVVGIAALVTFWSNVRTSLTCAVVAIVVLWFSRARYDVSESAIEVRIGLGWPSIRVLAPQIEDSSEAPLNTFKVGGWGYRGIWTLFHKVAISLGGSGGVRIRVHGGGVLHLSSNHARALNSAVMRIADGSRGR
jgi:hypothetical protein